MISLIVAYILDLLFGDPEKLPHPIVGFGKVISLLDGKINNGKNRVIKGMLLTIFLVSGVFLLFYFLSKSIFMYSNTLYYIFVSIFAFYGLANKTLAKECYEVFKVVKNRGIEAGRLQVSRIVGRDTSKLNENQVKTAALETLAENLSDGVIAPILYFSIFGIAGMMAYKMVNTLDSMIGYKSLKYKEFGMFAARLDDVANFLPARITALLMALISLKIRTFKYIWKYGNKHASPNSGYPESALAGILNCRFGGPNIYFGTKVDKPYIGENLRELTDNDIKIAIIINQLVVLIFIILMVLIRGLY